jgi:hypothetical protein
MSLPTGAAATTGQRQRITQGDRDAALHALAVLGREVGRDGTYKTWVYDPAGRWPYLHVKNPAVQSMTQAIHAGDGFFWWSWAEQIGTVGDVAAVAQKIMRVLRTRDSP